MEPSDVPGVEHILAAAEALRAEALALPDELFVDMPSRERYRGQWKGFLLRVGPWEKEFPQVDFAANRARCPVAMGVLEHLPNAPVAGFLRLDPGADLSQHTDFRDDDMVRVHLALQLPAEEAKRWPEGSLRLLDVRVPHSAKNPADRPRLTFVVDVKLGRPVAEGEVAPWDPPGNAAPPATPGPAGTPA